jgi:hypothetical protein
MLILSCLNLIVAPIDCSPGPNSGSQSGSVVKVGLFFFVLYVVTICSACL